MRYSKRRNNRRGSRKLIKKTTGGRVKQLVDGRYSGYVRAGVAAMPYVLRSIKMMKTMINSEEHYKDISNNTTFTSAGDIQFLSGIAQGDTDITRSGNKVLLKDILFRVNINSNSATQNTTVRMILFVDKECDGANPTVAQLLTSASPLSPLNMDFSKRFVIISDKLMSFSNTGQQERTFKIYKTLNFHALFDGNLVTVADAKENHIFALFISDTAANNPGYSYTSRIKFYDN